MLPKLIPQSANNSLLTGTNFRYNNVTIERDLINNDVNRDSSPSLGDRQELPECQEAAHAPTLSA